MRICLFLLLGAIVNVAVAWGFALWGDYRFDPQQIYSHFDRPRWMYSLNYGVGRTHVSFVPDNGNWGGGTLQPSAATLPYWSEARSPPANETLVDPGMPWYYEDAFGWPMRSTYGVLCTRKGRKWEAVKGLEVLRRNDASPLPFRLLPLQPITRGFAINTLFYAVILWLLFAAPLALRRRRRIKRGQCPACAYDLRGSDSPKCPECGTIGAASGRASLLSRP